MWQSGVVALWQRISLVSAKRNLEGHEITASRPRNYGAFKLGEFVLKIAIKREQSHARMSFVERERFR